MPQTRTEYYADWQRKRNLARALVPDPKKIQCKICKGYYTQICSHVTQAHGISAREYKEENGYDRKRGLIPEWYRKLKADICEDNGTIKNLEAGAIYRFKKGDKVGTYERSAQTLERLKHTNKKHF